MHITNGDRIQALILKAKVYSDEFFKWFGNWVNAAKENPYSKDISIGSPEADFSNVDSTGTGVLIPIFLNGEYIGETGLDNALYHKDKGMSIKGKYMEMPSVGGSNITIEKEYRGKGYGKATYFELAKLAANNGKILRSAPDKSRTPASTRVWESLVRDGYAKRVNDRYEIINSTLNNASKVVDENGEPLVVYHGNTDTNITKFTKGKGRYLKDGNYYFSPSKSVAESYATNGLSEEIDINDYLVIGYNVDANSEEAKYADFNSTEEFFNASLGGKVYSVFLNIKNPLFSDTITPKIENPYDGAITIPVKDTQGTLRGEKVRQYIATESNQIKSATDNIGTFDTNNSDIRYAKTELITPSEIYATAVANGSTDNPYGIQIVNNMRSYIDTFPTQYRDNIKQLLANDELNYTCQ